MPASVDSVGFHSVKFGPCAGLRILILKAEFNSVIVDAMSAFAGKKPCAYIGGLLKQLVSEGRKGNAEYTAHARELQSILWHCLHSTPQAQTPRFHPR